MAAEIARLKDELGHEPTPSELLLIEAAASGTVAARQCRRQGRNALVYDRLVVRALSSLHPRTGRKAARVKTQHPESFDQLSARIVARRNRHGTEC
jgi:hypothetical protein